jgi:hypothetical protein
VYVCCEVDWFECEALVPRMAAMCCSLDSVRYFVVQLYVVERQIYLSSVSI